MKRLLVVSMIAVVAISLSACGGSSSGGGGGGGTGLNNAQSVTGTALSSSGDPLPGVTVYLPGTTVSAQTVKATRTFFKAVTAADGTTCEDPPTADSPLAACCSGQDGSFNCDTSAVTQNATQIVFQKGSLRMVQNLSCTADPCALDAATTTYGGGTTTWPKVAVVTGQYDRIEDVLAKFADTNTSDDVNGQYGRVDSSTGIFVYGSEYGTNLTIIEGPMPVSPTENSSELTYQTWDKYLDGTIPLVVNGTLAFDVLFINCGGSMFDANLTANKSILQDYVNAGGRIYVTDLSYDFVEQPFPQVMKFENDPDDPSIPGSLGAAETGTDGVNLNATVNDTTMANWLKTVSVNGHDASTPGNPDMDCSGMPYDRVVGALNSSDLLPTGDFLSGWTHMVSAHTGETPTIWISSGSGVVFDGLDNRPLTVSMNVGSNGGRVVYSSYHTAHSCPSTTFWPQERVLQFVMFESF